MTDRIPLDHLNSDQLDALYDQLDALRTVARGYCPECGRGDAAPTVADWEQQRQRAEQAEAAIERARALAASWQSAVRPGEPHPAAAALLAALDEQPSPAATEATEPTTGAIVLRRERGIGVTVVEAPERTTMALDFLARSDAYTRVHDGVIEIADQVAYRVRGYDLASWSLVLDRVADWRTDATARAGQLATALGEVLGSFVHETHPGRRCLQSRHEDVETVGRWRALLKTSGGPAAPLEHSPNDELHRKG